MATVDPLGNAEGHAMTHGLTRFKPPPSPDAPFFPRSAVFDTRPTLVHENFPGHQTQLALSQARKAKCTFCSRRFLVQTKTPIICQDRL